MKGTSLIYLFVILWALVFAGSILMTLNIDGPRNIDTGFKRLDVLVRGQLLALLLALAAAVGGFFVRGLPRRHKLIALAPLGLTLIGVLSIVLFAMFFSRDTVETEPPLTTKPVTSAPAETLDTQD